MQGRLKNLEVKDNGIVVPVLEAIFREMLSDKAEKGA